MRGPDLLPLLIIALGAGVGSAAGEAPRIQGTTLRAVAGLDPSPAPLRSAGGSRISLAATKPQPASAKQGSTTHGRGSVSSAVGSLIAKANAQAHAGSGEQAAATLERALRIEPRNPWLWHRLAVLRLQQGYWQQAVQLATKSNTLSGKNTRLLGGNWEVMGRALGRLGDTRGARHAKAKSSTYFGRAKP